MNTQTSGDRFQGHAADAAVAVYAAERAERRCRYGALESVQRSGECRRDLCDRSVRCVMRDQAAVGEST